jgi:hypothetical protein
MHWGEGQIIEEARFEGEHAQPAIQLMRFDTGPAAGTLTLRFCHFNPRGQFQRSPMMLSEEEIDRLREAVQRTPEIRRFLLRIAGPPLGKGR